VDHIDLPACPPLAAVPREASPCVNSDAALSRLLRSCGVQPVGAGTDALCLGLLQMQYEVPAGTAAAVAAFYRRHFGCEGVEVEAQGPGGRPCAIVPMGLDGAQRVVFAERPEGERGPDYDGHHFALYLASHEAFEAAFNSLHAAERVWINPRFADKVDTLDAAQQELQFRIKDVEGFELEHEVRSPRHSSCPLMLATN
jgi:hypothetical protein